MKVVCINDSNKPKQIPQEKWIVKGNVYTVISTSSMNIQRNKIGLKLAEIDLGHTCFPYEYFDADRFAITTEAPVIKEEQLETA